MTLAEFKPLPEANFCPTENGMLGELVAAAERMVLGGTSILNASYHAAQEVRDALAEIQNLGDADLSGQDTAEFDKALESEPGDDGCDHCRQSGVNCSQTCPSCGAVLCAEGAVEKDGLCTQCISATGREEFFPKEGQGDRAAEAAP